MDLAGISSLILAGVAVVGAFTSYMLSKRGQNKDEAQHAAATELSRRAQMHEELNGIIARLREEVTDLRLEVDRVESVGDKRLQVQKERCRSRLDEMTVTITTLSAVVGSEVAREAGTHAVDGAQQHIDNDHREP